MTQRERFLDYMSFKRTDRVPLMDMGLWDETLDRWHGEGLPPWVTCLRHLEDYVGLDRSFNMNWLPIEQEIYPPMEQRVIEEDEDSRVISDELGVVYKERKRFKTIPHYIRFPVQNESDYEKYKEGLDGKTPGRYPEDFDTDLKWRVWRGEIVGVNFRSFFGFPRKLMGFENWCIAFYDQPRLVERMIKDRLKFAKDLFERALSTGNIDFIQVWEDMAFKTAPMIDPRLVRQYMLPAYKELVSFFHDFDVKLIMVDSDGHIADLIPLWMEAGISGCHPCEIAAGSDPVFLRNKYPNCALMGGIDKREIARGIDGVNREIDRITPVVKQGAFIPLIDHFIPPDISFDTYLYYVERKRKLLTGFSLPS